MSHEPQARAGTPAKGYAKPQAPSSERNKLIAEHVDMARRIALRVARRVPEWMSYDDLIASAMVGLTEAADRYDAQRGEPFPGFAEKRIRGAVLDELRRGDIMPRRARQNARKVGQTIQALERKLGRPPEDEEVAKALDISLEEYKEDLEQLTHVAVVAISPAMLQTHAGEEDNAEAQMQRAQLSKALRDGLKLLPERDATVLSLYYIEEVNYGEIAQLLGVTESRVCQLHGRAIARLRTLLNDRAGEGEED
jgi:RNA polymerase sigma factor for flagellar operon FliA